MIGTLPINFLKKTVQFYQIGREFLSVSPLAATQPTPVSLAFFVAISMQKFPTTGPRPLFPSTRAVAGELLIMVGCADPLQIPDLTSLTYISGTHVNKNQIQ